MTLLVPPTLIDPTGSTPAQVPISTGPLTPPVWGNVPYTSLTGLPTPAREVFTLGSGFSIGSTSITLAGTYGGVNNITVHFNGIYQSINNLASLVGNVLTFTSPIPAGVSSIYVDSFNVATVSSNPPIASVGVAQLAPDALALITPTSILKVFHLYAYMSAAQITDATTYTGALNTTACFQALSAAVNKNGGGKVVIPAGLYKVGAQIFSGATGKGYSYQGQSILSISGCTNPVVIELEGVNFIVDPTLKFGSFNPVTGATYAPTMPFTNTDYKASIGAVISLTNNTSDVSVLGNCDINGNLPAILSAGNIGGNFGDTGTQVEAYGVYMYNNNNVYVENVNSHHHCLDGLYLFNPGAVIGQIPKSTTLMNVRSHHNARQGLSWVGGIGLTAINCTFNYQGTAGLISSPGAGVDIEASIGNIISNGYFYNCEFGGNVGTGMVCDNNPSSDVIFDKCRFYGTVSSSVWPKAPRFKFNDCIIGGIAYNAWVATTDSDRTRFTRCLFSANEVFDGAAATYGSRLFDFTGQNPILDDCDFITSVTTVSLPASTNALYRNCRFTQTSSSGTGLMHGIYTGYNTINISAGSVDLSGTQILNGRISTSGNIVGIGVLPNGDCYDNTNSVGSGYLQIAGQPVLGNTATGIMDQESGGTLRYYIGSGGGQFNLSKRVSGVTTDEHIFNDNGTVTHLGAVTAPSFIGALVGNANTASTVVNAAQPTITSLGTLTGLSVSGTATFSGNGTFNSLGVATSLTASTIVAGNSLSITGPATLGVTNNGTLSYESPNYRFYIGDGTGYSFRLSKRASSTTTDQFIFNDNGTATFAGNLTAPTFLGNFLGQTVSVSSGGSLATTGAVPYVLSAPVAGQLQTNAAAGYSSGISSRLDNTSFEISAGSSHKNGIYIGGQTATDPQVFRIYNQDVNSFTATPSLVTINLPLTVNGAVTGTSFNGLINSLGVALTSGGSLASSGVNPVLSNPAAGRLKTNAASGVSPSISSFADTSSFEISAGSSHKNGIYIGGQSATDSQVFRIYNQDINTLTATPTGVSTSVSLTAPSFIGSGTSLTGLTASQIAFTQTGTGAVARTMNGKVQELVSAFDFLTTAQIADVIAGTMTQDCTAGLQAAINACSTSNQYSGSRLYLPAGIYKITASLVIPNQFINIIGAGKWNTQINFTGVAGAGLTVAAIPYLRPVLEGFAIVGDSTSGRALDFSPVTTQVYLGELRNLYLQSGGDGLYAPAFFSMNVIGVSSYSYNGHCFRAQCGPAVAWTGCYALSCGTGKAGYRLAGTINLSSCNGLNAGDYWGVFGNDTTSTDGFQSDFAANDLPDIVITACNIERFGSITTGGEGIRVQNAFRNFTVLGGKIDRTALTTAYSAMIHCRASSNGSTQPARLRFGSVFQGTGTPSNAYLYSDGAATFMDESDAFYIAGITSFKNGSTTYPLVRQWVSGDIYGDNAVYFSAVSPRRLTQQVRNYATLNITPSGSNQTQDVTGYSKLVVTPAAPTSIQKFTFNATPNAVFDYGRNGELIIEATNGNLTLINGYAAADGMSLIGNANITLTQGQVIQLIRTNNYLPGLAGWVQVSGITSTNVTFDSIAALRANTLTASTIKTATVLSYYGVNATALQRPPFQGIYALKTTDTTSADNGGSIIVDAAGNRWYLLQTGSICVDQFGAKGDGTTSDTSAIAATIAYALANNIGTVTFSDRTYYFGTALTILFDTLGLALNLVGTASVAFSGTAVNGTTFTGASGLTSLIVLTKTNLTTMGYYTFSAKNINFRGGNNIGCGIKNLVGGGPTRPFVLEACTFQQFTLAGLASDISTAAAAGQSTGICQVHIFNCNFSNNSGYGIYANGAQAIMDLDCHSNVIEQNTLGGIYGTSGAFSGGVNISNNLLEGQVNAIKISLGLGNVEVSKNYFESNTGYLIDVDAVNASSTATIKDNFVLACTGAIVRLTGICVDVPQNFNQFGVLLQLNVLFGKSRINNQGIIYSTFNYFMGSFDPGCIPMRSLPPATITNGTYVPVSKNPPVDTPAGYLRTLVNTGASTYLAAPSITVASGDWIVMMALMRVPSANGPFAPSITAYAYNSGNTTLLAQTDPTTGTGGFGNNEWQFVCRIVQASAASTGISVVWNTSTGVEISDTYVYTIPAGSTTTPINLFMPSSGILPTSQYLQTSSSGGTSIVDLPINYNSVNTGFGDAGLYQLSVVGLLNPYHDSSSSLVTGVVAVVTNIVNQLAVQQIYFQSTYTAPVTLSGSNPLTVTPVFWNGTTESTSISWGDLTQSIRLKISGYNSSYPGYGQKLTFNKIL